jgi:hypothetical protein
MNSVKNLHYISDKLTDGQQEKLEYGASLYRRHANITFKILKHNADNKELIVEVRQGKNALDKYLSVNELIERAKSLFNRFFPDYRIHCRPQPYQQAPVDQVTPQWISQQMKKNHIRLKDISDFTGIDNTNISAWINDLRPMSQPVKAMFYSLLTERDQKKQFHKR